MKARKCLAQPKLRYRLGRTVVTLKDAETGRRRDYRLGAQGALESVVRYHLLLAEWEARKRRCPNQVPRFDLVQPPPVMTVSRVARRYYRWALRYYDRHSCASIKQILRAMIHRHGREPAAEFGPCKLRVVREELIDPDPKSHPPRAGWSRKYINSQTGRIRHMFKWAASHELIPASIHQALCTVEALKRGRTRARENPSVGPVPDTLLQPVLPLLTSPVRAMVELQLLSGARPGEVAMMRPCDIDRTDSSGAWLYKPTSYKTLHMGKDRTIYFGPQAQTILKPFLENRGATEFLFSPIEADAERRAALHAARRTPLCCGNRPGTNRKDHPEQQPGQRYNTTAYNRAIRYACDRAFPPGGKLARQPKETFAAWKKRLGPKRWAEVKAWYRAHSWHVHQLRHNAGTAIRRRFGLEAAQVVLGHCSAQITDAVYAERDQARAIAVVNEIG